jgi:hypothetical protein
LSATASLSVLVLCISTSTGAGSLSFPAPASIAYAPLPPMVDARLRAANRPSICMANIRNFRDYWDVDPRAGLADLCGVEVLSPDQEHAVEVLHREPTAGLMGGVNTGKSWLLGRLALLYIGCHGNTKAIFSGPKEEQTALLSWAHLQAGYRYANEKAAAQGIAPMFGGKLNRYDWQCDPEVFPDWWARVYACQRGQDGSTMRGMMHSEFALALLEEVNSMDKTGVDALWSGTRAPGARFWFSFNPTDAGDTAGQLWAQLPSAGQVQLSLLRFIEWQERKGITLPGVTDRAVLERDFRKFEGTPLWYTNVLGQFPPESSSFVVVPKDWFDKCLTAEPTGIEGVGIGIDTGRGKAENVIAVVDRGKVSLPWISREQYETPITVTHAKEICGRYPKGTPIAVDVVGTGGAGVADDLRLDGFNALDFNGGGREFAGIAGSDPSMDLFTDRVTWAWWQLRLAAEATFDGRAKSVQFPDDPLLRDQLARGYGVAGERRFKLDSKVGAVSPDRGDAVAMAWAAMASGQSYEPRWG